MIWHEFDDNVESQQRKHEEEEEEEEEEVVVVASRLNFDFFSFLSKPKDYYRILEVDYDATEDTIRSNYIRLALKWHPDKKKEEDGVTSKFQDINEAYQILSDPDRRREYDKKGMQHVYDYNIILKLCGTLAHWGVRGFNVILRCIGKDLNAHQPKAAEAFTNSTKSAATRGKEKVTEGTHYLHWEEYLHRYKGLILTCNGLGMKHSIW